MHTRTFAAIVLAAATTAAVWAQTPKQPAAQPADDPRAQQLDDLLAKGRRLVEEFSAADARQAMELGSELLRPHVVAPRVKTYLARESDPPPLLLKLAAENARLVGDFRAAVTRQKQYLRAMPVGAEAAAGAAALCSMLMDMGEGDEAYAFMKESGEPLRSNVNTKKYDEWFLAMAWERGDLATVARWLAACLSDKAPIELERLLYWGDLDKLIEATRLDNAKTYNALPQIRRVATLIRESPARRARLQFQADYLMLCAGARGKEAAALTAEFAPVAASAKAWFDAAPSAATLTGICAMWSNAGGNDRDVQWQRAGDAKRDFFKQAFGRLSDAEKAAFLEQPNAWVYAQLGATPATWLELIKQTPSSPARDRWAARVGLPWQTPDAAVHKAAAPALAGILNGDAALMRALATSDDYYAVLQHLALKESWYFDQFEHLRGVYDRLPGVFRSFPRDEANKLPGGTVEKAFARYLREVHFTSPLPLVDSRFNRDYMEYIWQYSDKAKMAEALHLLDWVPLSRGERDGIFAYIQNKHYRGWAESVRREQAAAAKRSPEEGKKYDGQIALVEAIAAAFKQVSDPAVYDVNKAPTPLCRHIASLHDAVARQDRDAALAAARAAYALLRNYEQDKTPFGRMCLNQVLAQRKDVDLTDLRVEALGDQLALHRQDGRSGGLDVVVGHIKAGLHQNQLHRASAEDRVKLEAATSQAVLAMLNAGKFNARVFDLYRETRIDNPASREIMTKLIEGKVLVGQPAYRLDGRINAATTYQWLLEREFQWMNEKYPRESYFDDMFAEEVARTRLVDPEFWRFSRDTERKGANAVAAAFKGFTKLPFGYDGGTPVYTPDAFWRVYGEAVNRADAAPRQELLAAAAAAFGKTRFDDYAIGRVGLNFVDVTKAPENRKQFFDLLTAMLDRARTQPRIVRLPNISVALANLRKAGKVTDAELAVLQRMFLELRADGWDYQTVAEGIDLLHDGMKVRKREADLLPQIPAFWAMAREMRDHNRRRDLYNKLVTYTAAAAEGDLLELAATYSTTALALGVQLPSEMRRTAEAVRAQALVAIGGVIPVDRGDRRYPVYAAQLAYLTGQYDQAWTGYLGARELVLAELKNLDPLFIIWVIEEATAKGEYEEAENLARAMIATVETAAVQMSDAESRARLFLAYADIALARQEYPRAKSQYERVALAKEYEGTRARILAEVKVADVERLIRDYDGAIQRLEALLRRDDRYTRTQANYLLALVKYDQEEYADARDYLNQALQLDSAFADARILEGKLHLKLKKLVEATQVKVGFTAAQRIIVPGRPLKVEIEDRNLSVVGAAMGIEVRVWSSSGDEEFFNLVPFGDSKIHFEGQIVTELGGASKNDHVLQVLGGDEVRYDFSERFRNANNLAAADAPPVTVMSDPELFASSGDILSREEMAEMALERQILARTRAAGPPGEPATVAALSTIRSTSEIKPGNPIRVRVVDPDRSVTAGKDRISLRATASNGDTVEFFELVETEDCSGVFDGELKTGVAPATAFASDSDEGADPNFAISGGEYPPWVGLTDGNRPKLFSFDLNDRVELASLAVQADVPARRIERFAVRTSLNGRSFQTVGLWPDELSPWDGSLQMALVRFPAAAEGATDLDTVREFLSAGYLSQKTPRMVLPGMLAASFDANILGHGDRLGVSRDKNDANTWYLMHLRGGFYLPRRAERTFRVSINGPEGAYRAHLVVNGEADKLSPTEITRTLGKGVHVLDFYLWTQRNTALSFDIQCDIPEAPYFATCPMDMFDIVKYPKIGAALKFTPATIVPQADNKVFDITFAPNTQARVVQLQLLDFEGDAPGIQRLTLRDTGGRQRLPTEEDLLSLRKNKILETRAGDRITITYEDPTPITDAKRVQEASLSATFYNAGINACFIEVVTDAGGGSPRTEYVRMRRFRRGDVINVLIRDPDLDVSDKADVVKFIATPTLGAPVELEALEMGSGSAVRSSVHSGVFVGRIFTVDTEPQRPSELQLGLNDDVEISYLDEDNTDYGIPWQRSTLVEQAGTNPPVIRMFDFASSLLPPDQRIEEPGPDAGQTDVSAKRSSNQLLAELQDEFVPAQRVIGILRRDSVEQEHPATGMVICPVPVEVTWPAVALSPRSAVKIHVQSSSSRKLAGVTNPAVFDPLMPGTLTTWTGPSGVGGIGRPPGYKEAVVRRSLDLSASTRYLGDALDQGLFTFAIPLQLAAPSTKPPPDPMLAGVASEEEGEVPPGVLAIRPDDEIVLGFPYSNPDAPNVTNWFVRHVKLLGDPMLDVMDQRFKKPLHSIFMGEKVFLRVVDPMADISEDKGERSIQVRAGDMDLVKIALSETFPHSGVFKGVVQVMSVREATATNRPGVVAANHGDTITLAYSGGLPTDKVERSFTIAKGADGLINAFTKHFKDQSIAVQTQFTVAESYFELAKNHRALKQAKLARQEIAQGRKLLQEAILDFPQNEARAQAEYLLAELSLELAQDAPDMATKEKHSAEALQRFNEIVATYGDSPYAPKAQFKKAMTLEKLGQIDQACEEYVRLSYKYPDNALVAETIARLGQYFLTKGKGFETEIAAASDLVKGEKLRLQSVDMFTTAAQVFGRLAKRFPDHQLAAKTTVLSGQCYMRAKDFEHAVGAFNIVIASEGAENELKAEAMYWCGDAHLKNTESKSSPVDAYRMFKKLTWDHPESQWAKYARARLTEPVLAKADM